MLSNDGSPFWMNFRHRQICRKRYGILDELISLLTKSLSHCLTILLGLLLVGNEFLALKFLFFLENSVSKVPLLGKRQVIGTEHFNLDLH